MGPGATGNSFISSSAASSTTSTAIHFSDLAGLDIVGVFPNYATAYDAWKAKAQSTVDNARVRYFIVHLLPARSGCGRTASAGSPAEARWTRP